MGLLYRQQDGTEVPIAGTMTSGELIPSVSYYQKGIAVIPAKTTGSYYVTLPNAMPDSDYVLVYKVMYINGEDVGNGVQVGFTSQTATSFQLWVFGTPNDRIEVDWQAFKLMTDKTTALDEAQIEANRNAITALQTDRLKRYALNAFDPSISEDHLGENYTIGHTSVSNPPTSSGNWWEVVQFNAQHFAIQLWTNEFGYSYIRFRHVAVTSSAWSAYRRIDSPTISEKTFSYSRSVGPTGWDHYGLTGDIALPTGAAVLGIWVNNTSTTVTVGTVTANLFANEQLWLHIYNGSLDTQTYTGVVHVIYRN